jgi:hypothetical protein
MDIIHILLAHLVIFLIDVQLDKTTLQEPSSKAGYYLPILFVNDFWLLREHLTSINETVK